MLHICLCLYMSLFLSLSDSLLAWFFSKTLLAQHFSNSNSLLDILSLASKLSVACLCICLSFNFHVAFLSFASTYNFNNLTISNSNFCSQSVSSVLCHCCDWCLLPFRICSRRLEESWTKWRLPCLKNYIFRSQLFQLTMKIACLAALKSFLRR